MITVDIGNTSLHFVWMDNRQRVLKTKQIATSHANTECISKIIASSKDKKIIICSVVPKVIKIFERLQKKSFADIYIVGNDIKIPIKSFYNTKQIGMDRLVGAYAAKNIYDNARIVIDFGTAITLDILSVNGEYRGGVILPGVGSTLKVLSSCALLPKQIKLYKAKLLIPTNTYDSINIGIEEGFSSMMNSLVMKYKNALRLMKNDKIIITGGDAEFILPALRFKYIYEPFLVAKGLVQLASEYIT